MSINEKASKLDLLQLLVGIIMVKNLYTLGDNLSQLELQACLELCE